MFSSTRVFFGAVGLFLFAGLSLPAESRNTGICRHEHSVGAAPLEPRSENVRQYARSREIDILRLVLDVTPNFERRSVQGTATWKFKPVGQPLSELALDGVNLQVSRVEPQALVRTFNVTTNKVTVYFNQPIAVGAETEISLTYSAEPERGLYFRTPELGYPKEDMHIWTQGEADEARHWYPCYDFPNEKFASEIKCTVPAGLTVLSNGKLVSSKPGSQPGTITVHWAQEKPHVNYLISLIAGNFKKLEDVSGRVPMAFYTVPSEFSKAANSFRDTQAVMKFMEEETGVPYPWDRYDQVCVSDFHFGGMENTSITTLTDRTLFTEEVENVHSSQDLVAHELAHQWFGDLVTCKEWSEIWLNEGFATYYTHLFNEKKNGRDAMLYGLLNDARGFLDVPNDTVPIVTRNFANPIDQFGFRAYPKGSWVVHMLRSQVGPETFRKVIKNYLERHQYGNVVTADLQKAFEEETGRSWDIFFDQWLHHAHQPKLGVSFSYDANTKLLKFSVAQRQTLSDTVLLFQFPLPVKIITAEGKEIHHVLPVRKASEDFYLSVATKPKWVRVDPELTVLCKMEISAPVDNWKAQLTDPNDAIGRVLAAEFFGKQGGAEAVDLLAKALSSDPFHGVRIEAAKGLAAKGTPEARKVLIAHWKQPDARVRLQVINSLSSLWNQDVRVVLEEVARTEANPEVVAAALRGLGLYPESKSTLWEKALSTSYRNVVGDAALEGLRKQLAQDLIPQWLALVQQSSNRFTAGGLGRSLDHLAYLARGSSFEEPVYHLLTQQAQQGRSSVQTAALSAMGTLESRRAIPLLQTYLTRSPDNRWRRAAEASLRSIQSQQKAPEGVQQLREEVQKLQEEGRSLRKELETLQKEMKAQPKSEPAPAVIEKQKPRRPKR